MKNTLLALLLLFTANSYSQTWVQVPDVNFQNYLTANYPAAAFMTSGSDFFVDADHTEIQAEDLLDISNLSISSIDGIQAFENLVTLVCYGNELTSLLNLPSGLISLRCENNQITSLPSLPNGLLELWCFDNELTALPALPVGLTRLACMSNSLTSIPVLPVTLEEFQCDVNYLTVLPELPAGLVRLSCAQNSLTELPDLPLTLTILDCSDNPITSLPNPLPPGLTDLSCWGNPINILPPLPSTLIYLSCVNCGLTELQALPPNLQHLQCFSNNLGVLPDFPQSLIYIDCSGTGISELPLLPQNLTILNCSYNFGLTSIGTLPQSLNSLHCETTSITDLGELPPALQFLKCANSQINCFSTFPATIQTFEIQGNPFTCLPNYIPVMDATTLAYPLCEAGNPNGCQSAMGIQGSVFEDVNNNCIDSGLPLTYIPMFLNDNSGNLITSSTSLANGDYYFAAAEGDYQLEINTTALSPALEVTCPVNNENTTTVTQAVPVVEGGDFGLVCSGFDLGVQSVVSYGLVFPGQTHELQVLAGDLTAQFQAYCAAGISGDVSITVSGPGAITFSGSPSISGNTATYSVADFGAVGANVFSASILTDTTANSSDEFCVSVSVNTAATGDLVPSNNTYTYCYAVVNSYDPNIKETYPELVAPGYTDELTYTIHFQNTGNAPAINIRLADVLDNNLDLTTLKIVNASDDYTMSVNAVSRLMTIRFPNIMLADSASDPVGSTGYVQYRIKPVVGLPNGTIIENTCSIYFDYNSPIVTNTTQNVFGYLETDELSDANIKLYPNPASGNVMVEAAEVIDRVELYALDGNRIGEFKVNSKKVPLSILNYGSGVYLVKITTDSGISNKRLVIR